MLIICEFKMHVNIIYDQISIYPSKVHMVSYTSYIKLISKSPWPASYNDSLFDDCLLR